MATAGSIVVDLLMRTGSFETDAQRASKAADKRFKEIEKSAKQTAASIDRTFKGLLSGALFGVSAGAVFTKFITETKNAQNEQAQLAAVLNSTERAAGFSARALNKMASEMSGIFSEGEINQAQTSLLAFTGIVGDQFPRALQSAIDMSARTGQTVVQAAETIGRALDVPSKGLTALSKQGFRFTEDQKKLAEKLESTGKTAEAQGIILKALEESYGGAADAARNTLGGALTAMQNQIDSLMAGDDGSVNGLTAQINDLTDALGSQETKEMFASFVGWMADAAKAVLGLANEFALGMRYSDGFFDALGKYGLTDPSKSASQQLERVRKEIGLLEKDLDGLTGSMKDGSVSLFDIDPMSLGGKGKKEALHSLRQQEQYWSEMARRMEAEVFGSYRDVGETGASVFELPPIPVSPTKPKGKKGTVDKDPLGTFIKGEDLQYQLAEYQKYLDFRDKVTGQAMAKQRDTEQKWLEGLLDMGEITKEQYTKTLGEMQGVHTETLDEMGEFAKQAARNIQTALGDNMYSLLKGNFDDIGTAFSDMLLKMAADLAASQLSSALLGNFDKTGNIGGLLGNLMSGVKMGLGGPVSDGGVQLADTLRPMFDGGGYTGPGGKHDPAGIVHKGEVVFSQDDVRRHGGVSAVEATRLRGYSNGGIVGGGVSGAVGGVTVNVIGGPQEQPEVRTSRDQKGGLSIDLIYKQFIDRAAGDVASGQGKLGGSIQKRFGLVPQLG